MSHEYIDLEDQPFAAEDMLRIGEKNCTDHRDVKSFEERKRFTKLMQQSGKGNKVLVCCMAGKSRSASMIVLYLKTSHFTFYHIFNKKYPQMSYDDILTYINSVRPIGINHGFADALRNVVQKKFTQREN